MHRKLDHAPPSRSAALRRSPSFVPPLPLVPQRTTCAPLTTGVVSRMSGSSDINHSLALLEGLLRDVAEHLGSPTKANRRSAALKLERIVAIASTLAATIHTPRN